ncbi:MAG: hypothetical protein FWG13_04105, partial [Leptospirales bacterium]|nr:hypothetical protein [Leptospirales bacterium]
VFLCGPNLAVLFGPIRFIPVISIIKVSGQGIVVSAGCIIIDLLELKAEAGGQALQGLGLFDSYVPFMMTLRLFVLKSVSRGSPEHEREKTRAVAKRAIPRFKK